MYAQYKTLRYRSPTGSECKRLTNDPPKPDVRHIDGTFAAGSTTARVRDTVSHASGACACSQLALLLTLCLTYQRCQLPANTLAAIYCCLIHRSPAATMALSLPTSLPFSPFASDPPVSVCPLLFCCMSAAFCRPSSCSPLSRRQQSVHATCLPPPASPLTHSGSASAS